MRRISTVLHHRFWIQSFVISATTIAVLLPMSAMTAGAEEGSPIAMRVSANQDQVMVGVGTKFSTWSDLTAIFRPSRWKNAMSPGGAFSWLSGRSWKEEPGRTAKVLLGEVVVVGTAAIIVVATSGGGGGGDSGEEEASAPTTDGTSGATVPSGAQPMMFSDP